MSLDTHFSQLKLVATDLNFIFVESIIKHEPLNKTANCNLKANYKTPYAS
ncbi:unnamed protein product [Amoebophrya sp. A120]|nr:unnamed protein product [Amoebophrya sp. A120]|eukprot:GSA120T00003616001.1